MIKLQCIMMLPIYIIIGMIFVVAVYPLVVIASVILLEDIPTFKQFIEE